MHGLGNDSVGDGLPCIDIEATQVRRWPTGARRRLRSVLLLEPAQREASRSASVFSDGGEVGQCGNGRGCVARTSRTARTPHDAVVIEALAGLIV